eukprot:TRINITY_DN16461_c0_g1_i1.p1 TRINITY_DN16461_c0_g1~~TRINITY_DN16461_c0_g1_i1.p1  ORF type:complete len:505 (-),score=67.44 TRINITY_DN16461_c0_g1_i1:204-1565(-)
MPTVPTSGMALWSSPRTQRDISSRYFSPLTAGGIRQSIFTLVQTAIGGGVLTIAFSMRMSGIIVGALLLCISALIAVVGMDILMRSAVKQRVHSFGALLVSCFGPRSGIFLDIALFVYGNGALIAYFIFLGDFLPSIVKSFAGGVPAWASSDDDLRMYCMCATLIVILPLALAKNLSALRYVTPVAFIALLYTVTVVSSKTPGLYSEHVGEPGYGDLELGVVDINIFHAFSITLFAYNCHLNVVPVGTELRGPSDARILKISMRVAIIQLIFYLLIAVGGYMSFLAQTGGDLLKSYSVDDRFILVSRIMLSFTIIVGIPVNAMPTISSAMNLVAAFRVSPTAPSPLLGGGDESPVVANDMVTRRILTLLCIAMQLTVAILCDKVAVVIGYMGATIGTAMMILLPAMILQKVLRDEFSVWHRRLIVVFLYSATLFNVVGVVVMLLQDLGFLPKL